MNTTNMRAASLDMAGTSTYNQTDVERIITGAVTQAIERYESQRGHLENAISSDLSQNGKENVAMSSKYRERIRTGTDANGEHTYVWVCASTKDELHTEIAKVLSGTQTLSDINSGDIASDGQRAPSELANCIPWQDVADEWFRVFHVSRVREKTLLKDTSLFKNHVSPAFFGRPIDSITPSDIQTYLETKSCYCKSQLRDIMAMLKQIFSLALEKGCISRNPMQSMLIHNPSKKPDRPRDAISREHQFDIIAHLDDLRDVYDRNGDNMNALRFMAFLMFTGMRPCEIYGLRWEDIDIQNKTLSIQRDLVFVSGNGVLGKPKTATSNRTIPFDPALLRYIEPVEDSGFIIHMTEEGRTHEHFSETAASNMWNRIKRAIDVHGMTPYMARHTYATNMNKAGVPIKTAMSMMGHKDERMLLRRYTHTDNEDLTIASKLVSDYVTESSAT